MVVFAPGGCAAHPGRWALIGAGLWLIGRPGDRATGVLLTTAGFDWFVAD